MFRIEFTQTAHTLYNGLKDFQPFFAACLALCAAAAAYISAQHVVKKQALLTREITAQQLANALAREDENELKQRIAFLIMLGSRFRALVRSLNSRISALELFRETSRPADDDIRVRIAAAPYWQAIAALKPLSKENWFFRLKWEEVSVLNAEDQSILNVLLTLLNSADNSIKELLDLEQQDHAVLPGFLQSTINSLKSARDFIPIAEERISKSINDSMEDRIEVRRRLQITEAYLNKPPK